jgi:hypothetical protein
VDVVAVVVAALVNEPEMGDLLDNDVTELVVVLGQLVGSDVDPQQPARGSSVPRSAARTCTPRSGAPSASRV